MSPPESNLRVVQIACLVLVLTSMWLSTELRRRTRPLGWTEAVIIVMALWAALSGFTLQRRIVSRPPEIRLANSSSMPFTRWRTGNLVRLASATSVAFWGLILAERGGPLWLVWSFFAGGVVLLLVWRPGRIREQTAQSSPGSSKGLRGSSVIKFSSE